MTHLCGIICRNHGNGLARIARGVPIDCVGHQFLNTINFPIDDQGSAASKQNVIDTINLLAGLTSTVGVPIMNEVTEFDMSLYRFGNCWQTTLPPKMGSGQVTCTAAALANGATAQFTLSGLATCPTPSGAVWTDSATVTSTTLNPNPTPQNTGTVNFVVANPSNPPGTQNVQGCSGVQ